MRLPQPTVAPNLAQRSNVGYLPEGDQHLATRSEEPRPLPAIGSVAEAELKWTGEDAVEGTVRIIAGAIGGCRV